MPLNAITSLPLPRSDPEAVRTTGGSEATALSDAATAAHATQARLRVQRIATLRRALELFPATRIIHMCFSESCAPCSRTPDLIFEEVYGGRDARSLSDGAANDAQEMSKQPDADNRYKRPSVAPG